MKPEFAAQTEACRLLRENRVRSCVDHESVDCFSANKSANSRCGFEQQEGNALLVQLVGRCEAADTSSHNDTRTHRHGRPYRNRRAVAQLPEIRQALRLQHASP